MVKITFNKAIINLHNAGSAHKLFDSNDKIIKEYNNTFIAKRHSKLTRKAIGELFILFSCVKKYKT